MVWREIKAIVSSFHFFFFNLSIGLQDIHQIVRTWTPVMLRRICAQQSYQLGHLNPIQHFMLPINYSLSGELLSNIIYNLIVCLVTECSTADTSPAFE